MTKKKAPKKRKKAPRRRPGSEAAAEETLERMIAEKVEAVGDGSLQVIQAIASCTALVTVDVTKTPPRVTPPNLGALKFNSPTVGLSNAQMALFKASLAELLPQIAADIAQIPENAALKISAVADFVRLALLAA